MMTCSNKQQTETHKVGAMLHQRNTSLLYCYWMIHENLEEHGLAQVSLSTSHCDQIMWPTQHSTSVALKHACKPRDTEHSSASDCSVNPVKLTNLLLNGLFLTPNITWNLFITLICEWTLLCIVWVRIQTNPEKFTLKDKWNSMTVFLTAIWLLGSMCGCVRFSINMW